MICFINDFGYYWKLKLVSNVHLAEIVYTYVLFQILTNQVAKLFYYSSSIPLSSLFVQKLILSSVIVSLIIKHSSQASQSHEPNK